MCKRKFLIQMCKLRIEMNSLELFIGCDIASATVDTTQNSHNRNILKFLSLRSSETVRVQEKLEKKFVHDLYVISGFETFLTWSQDFENSH